MEAFLIGLTEIVWHVFQKQWDTGHIWKKDVWFVGLSCMSMTLIARETFWFYQLFLLMMCCLYEQDRQTYYISFVWSIPCMGILLGWYWIQQPFSIAGALLYGFPATVLKWKKPEWIGSADVILLYYFGFLLGVHRMMIAMLISIGVGFIWSLFGKNKMIPYLSCLSIGVIISAWKGYTLWTFIGTFLHL